MSSDDLADLFVHEVTVRTYRGTSSSGAKIYDSAVTVPCFLSRRQRFIRAADGQQVLSQATVSAAVTWADTLAPQSQITIGGETQPTTIMRRDVPTGGTFVTGLDRVKAYLQ